MKPSKRYSLLSLLFILTVFDHPKATLFSFTAREGRRAVLAGLRIIHLLFRRQERTLGLYHNFTDTSDASQPQSRYYVCRVTTEIWRWEFALFTYWLCARSACRERLPQKSGRITLTSCLWMI